MRGNLQAKIRIEMTQHRVLKCSRQIKNRTEPREDLLQQKQTKTWTFQRVRGHLQLKVQTSSTSTQSGQTVTRFLPSLSDILGKSTKTSDRKLVANQETT